MAGARQQGVRGCRGSSRSPLSVYRSSFSFLPPQLSLAAAHEEEGPMTPPLASPAAPGRFRLHFYGPARQGEASAEKPPVVAERNENQSER